MPPKSFQTVRLARGKHRSPDDGVCIIELCSMLAGEPFSDRPKSVCRVIAALLRAYNDAAGDRRQELYPCAALIVGTRASAEVERRRVDRCLAELDQLTAITGRVPPLRRVLQYVKYPGTASRLRRVVAEDPIPDAALDELGRGLVGLLQRRDPVCHDHMLALVDDLVRIGAPRRPARAPVTPRKRPAALDGAPAPVVTMGTVRGWMPGTAP
jgi:hypothetical protein